MQLFGVVLVCFSCLVVDYVTGAPGVEPLCSTSVCAESAKYLRQNMNTSVEPCDDFYEYACGGWPQHHQIQEWRSHAGLFDMVDDQMEVRLGQLLATDHRFTRPPTTANSVLYARHLYGSCMRTDNNSVAEAVRMVDQVMMAITGHTWRIARQTTDGGESNGTTWNEHFVRAFAHGRMSPIFQIAIVPDPRNATSKIISINPGELGLGLKELQNLTSNPQLVAAYMRFISDNAELFCGQEDCPLLFEDIGDILNFESELAKVRMSIEDSRNPDKTSNLFTLQELSKQTGFDWLTELFVPILRQLGFKVKTTESSAVRIVVRVSDPQYLIQAMRIVQRTPTRVVANYIGLKIVHYYGSWASDHFRRIEFALHQVNSGLQKMSTRHLSCVSLIDSLLPMAVSRLFVDHWFSATEKAEAVAMVDAIQTAFDGLLQHNAWLDSNTKQESLRKLRHVRKFVAYPEWLLNNTQLDEHYVVRERSTMNVLLADRNYLLGIVHFYVNDLKNELVHFQRPVNETKKWRTAPATINASYAPNRITIPAGILQFPFYNASRPFALNYGFIGVVIGHEFTHGLDDRGRKYDYRGNLHDWWSPEAAVRFANRSQCFVRQYSESVDAVTGLNLNGRLTLSESIADNGGLQQSYNAFHKRHTTREPSPRLATLDHLSAEQLFFVSFANTWCGFSRPEALRRLIQYNPHAPGHFRVNNVLRNSVEFAQAFNCPVGSKMNPVNKCQVW